MASIRKVYRNLFESPIQRKKSDGYVEVYTEKGNTEYVAYGYVTRARPATGASMSHAGGDPAEGGTVEEIAGMARIDPSTHAETEMDDGEWQTLFTDKEQDDILARLNEQEPEYTGP